MKRSYKVFALSAAAATLLCAPSLHTKRARVRSKRPPARSRQRNRAATSALRFPAVPPLTNTPPAVTGVVVKSTETGAVKTIPVDGVFVAIGHSPASAVFADQLKMKQGGYIWTAADSTATSIEGVYAAGDIVMALDQISVAMGHAAVAATAMHNDLRNRDGQTTAAKGGH